MSNSSLPSDVHKLAIVGDYLPRKCGIATFTHDIYNSIKNQYPEIQTLVVSVNDREERYDYPDEVRFEIEEQDLASYRRAADFLNISNVDVVCLQHEFGIYGGNSGSHLLHLIRELRMPVVTTLHTLLETPSEEQMLVMKELCQLSTRLVVMTEKGKQFLKEIYGVDEAKIDLIPHGIPDMPFTDPNYYKDQFDVEGKNVLLTFGLLSPNKGIEIVLRALPEIVKAYPNVVYLVLGVTHPNLIRDEGEIYRLSLERLAKDLGVKKNVIFYNRFISNEELKEFLGATDIYITPYLNAQQITSGTLSYSFGCGKAVISTPYWHAEELLADGRGILVPFNDSPAIAEKVIFLLKEDNQRHAMRKAAYKLGREMVWSNVIYMYHTAFKKSRHAVRSTPRISLGSMTLDRFAEALPAIKLDHLEALTDSTGIIQHAKHSIPNYDEGYCTDDNARALILCVLIEKLGVSASRIKRLETTYLAFINHAFDAEKKRFKNFLTYDRRWVDEQGSEDAHGRALWSIGTFIGRSTRLNSRSFATQLFEQALSGVSTFNSPRAWAFTLMGIDEYLKVFTGDRFADQIRSSLTLKMVNIFKHVSREDWVWFEDIVSYDNAKLPHSLLLSAEISGDTETREIALRVLEWLSKIQITEEGHFRPIGSNGFYKQGGKPAQFDQQPLEAQSFISACIEAFRQTKDPKWYEYAGKAFDWYLGRNDLGQCVYDPITGGCCDALHIDRVNLNQGAESTLAFLISLAEMKTLHNELQTFNHPL
jgi:glycosyltransferase involved in cell wall biosynthesis